MSCCLKKQHPSRYTSNLTNASNLPKEGLLNLTGHELGSSAPLILPYTPTPLEKVSMIPRRPQATIAILYRAILSG